MKNKRIIVLIITILVASLPINVLAGYSGIDTDINIGSTGAQSSSTTITNRVVGTLQVAGTIISVISIIIIGIRYMTSSVQEKANLKSVLWYWLVGALLVLATSNIVKLVYDIITGIG